MTPPKSIEFPRGISLPISFCFGFIVGCFFKPSLLYSVEIAQVVSGKIFLPTQNPMYLHHTSIYSFLCVQLPAFLLQQGISEDTLCMLMSGLQVALSFSAITACALAFSGSELVSLLAPLVVAKFEYAPHKYPIFFPIAPHDAGMFGFYAALLALSLFSINKKRSGLFLTGMLPSIHLSCALAVYTGIISIFIFSRKKLLQLSREEVLSFGLGFSIFLASFSFHLLSHPRATNMFSISGENEQYVHAFLRWWDSHRKPADVFIDPRLFVEFFKFDLLMLVFSVTVVLYFRDTFSRPVLVFSQALIGVTFLAISFTIFEELTPEVLPVWIKTLMITRWLNYNSIILPIASICLMTQAALLLWKKPATIMLLCLLFIELTNFAVQNKSILAEGVGDLRSSNREEVRFFEVIQHRPGLLFTAHNMLEWAQSRTRRGLVLDTFLVDVLPYVPWAGTSFEKVLSAVYGVTLLDAAGWDQFSNLQTLWEERSIEEWRVLRDEFQGTDVLVPGTWHLKLPEVIKNEGFTLYHIPTAEL